MLTKLNARYRLLGVACLGAVALALAGCGTAPLKQARGQLDRSPIVYGSASDAMAIPSRLQREQASDVTLYALGLVGTPYRYGGNTPEGGFDCSGLIKHVYQSRAGIAAPRTVAQLQHWGEPLPGEALRSGDLVLFAQRGEPTHAGIYVGEGRFVHAPSSGGEVRLDRLNSAYWSAQRMAFRRT